MTFIYNSQIINAINKSRPDVVANFYVIHNFINDIRKRNLCNLNKLCEYLLLFLSEFGKGCPDYINNQYQQELYIKQNNECIITGLSRSICTLFFTEEENEYLEKMMKHFEYT